jgi:quercetin 2,3-dioxygenase
MIRSIHELLHAVETMEGAGVRLHRAFGYHQLPRFDPFLMLDDFRGESPDDYIKGFPWHPHRGIETVTYMLEGKVEHGDSMGNSGVISGGDLQWMTAGGGIVHQEMPKPVDGKMGGFQLWVNLPAADKFRSPRYQEIAARDIPMVSPGPGVTVKVLAGTYEGVHGPVTGIVVNPVYLDIALEPGAVFQYPVTPGYTGIIYVYDGRGTCGPGGKILQNRDLALLSDGDGIELIGSAGIFRVLLFAGKPIGEPIAWGGPIVMNTREELDQAFAELNDGTFIRSPAARSPVL